MRTEQPTKCLYHISYGESGCAHKTSLSSPPPGIRYRPFQGGGPDVVLCCLFWCQSFGDVSPYVCLGKKLRTRLAICTYCILSICILFISHFGFKSERHYNARARGYQPGFRR